MKRAALLAVLTSAVLPVVASAQRVDNRVNNAANNRIGGGGNEPVNRGQYGNAIGNQIVNGNVTGGREFRGAINYSDPRAFRGFSSGTVSDRFIRQSSGVTTSGYLSNNASGVRAFYGQSRAVAPPPNFVQQPGTVSYVPARTMYNSVASNYANPDLSGSVGLGNGTTYSNPSALDPIRYQTELPNSLDGTFDANQPPLAYSNYTVLNRPQGTVDAEQLRRMRDELSGAKLDEPGNRAGNRVNADGTPVDPNNPQRPADPNDPSRPNSSGVNNAVDTRIQPAGGTGNQALTSDGTIPQESPYQPLAEAARQSTQVATLQSRLADFYKERFGTDPAAAAEKNNELIRKQNAPQDPTKPGDGTTDPNQPTPTDGTTPPDRNATDPNAPRPNTPNVAQPPVPNAPPKPLKITSLAEGVQARGLGELLKNAEELMRQGKYASAIRQYEAAEQVAPNNGMILVGQAVAELGASFYRSAEMRLREAFTLDRSLMLAQYDLRAMLPEDRLQKLVNELKDQANANPDQVMPVFLLAFISYNTGNEANAAGYLELANTRAKGQDDVVRMVREHWTLTPGGETK